MKNTLEIQTQKAKNPQTEVYEALTGKKEDVYQAIDDLHKLTAVEIPYPLKGIKDRKVLHKGVIDKEEILDFVAKRIEEL